MVTVGTNKKGCLNQKVAPHNAKIEELRQVGFAVPKDPDGENLQLQPEMTMKDIDTYLHNLFPRLFAHIDGMGHNIKDDDDREPSSGSFPWFLIVKSGKNMWADQFIYFGTVHEISDEVDDPMADDSELVTSNGDKQNAPSTQSRTKDNRSNLKPQQVKLTFKPKKHACSNSPLFGKMSDSDSDIEFVGQQLSPSLETTLGLVEELKKK
ncbi:hypothetical protein BDR03DRAFT_1010891 [Suillus americanus]|nr:hypothetical protein BDR03DRAFT_1010891 [Suillus americanus]